MTWCSDGLKKANSGGRGGGGDGDGQGEIAWKSVIVKFRSWCESECPVILHFALWWFLFFLVSFDMIISPLENCKPLIVKELSSTFSPCSVLTCHHTTSPMFPTTALQYKNTGFETRSTWLCILALLLTGRMTWDESVQGYPNLCLLSVLSCDVRTLLTLLTGWFVCSCRGLVYRDNSLIWSSPVLCCGTVRIILRL